MQIKEENNSMENEAKSVSSEDQVNEITEIAEDDSVEIIGSEEDLLSLSKVQLINKLEELLSSDDMLSGAEAVRMIKDAYDKNVKEEYDRKLKLFVQDGSLEEDFEPAIDSLDTKAEKLFKDFNRKKTDQRKQNEKVQQDNLSTKKLIVEELRELLKSEDNFTKAYNKFQALQSKWRATGNVPKQEIHNLKENYNFLVGKFYDMIKISNELRELDRKKNLETKNELCEKADKLVEEPSLKKALDSLRFLQEEWKESNNLSKELSDPLWQRFKAASDKIYERRKEHVAKVKLQLHANLSAKAVLCERMEKLKDENMSSHKLCREAAEKAEGIWQEWQKIGFVPKSDNNNCWKRFKKARHDFQHALDSYYAGQRKEFSQNLQKKVDLCVKAESLQESTDWRNTAETLKKLQAEWKDIGSVAQKDSQPMWNRFRKACDHFFESKNKEVKEKENALLANVQIKDAIVAKLNALEPLSDAKLSIEELKKVQQEWAGAGAVPLREEVRLNNAFGKATDTFLEKVKVDFPEEKNIFRIKYEQMLTHQQGKDQIQKERFALQDKIKKLDAEANQLENNLGFFGKSKKANPILDEYLKKLDDVKQELVNLRAQLKVIPSV